MKEIGRRTGIESTLILLSSLPDRYQRDLYLVRTGTGTITGNSACSLHMPGTKYGTWYTSTVVPGRVTGTVVQLGGGLDNNEEVQLLTGVNSFPTPRMHDSATSFFHLYTGVQTSNAAFHHMIFP